MEEKTTNKILKSNWGFAIAIALAMVIFIQVVSYSANYGCGYLRVMSGVSDYSISILQALFFFIFWGLVVISLVLFIVWIITQLNRENEIFAVKGKRK